MGDKEEENEERTSRENGSLRRRGSVVRWYRRISRRATVPGRKRCFRPVGAGSPAIEYHSQL